MSKIKMKKGIVLGSVGVIVAIGGAQAADLPLKAKAVEYVKVCSLYGAGFYYIPGTDTCIRIGGYVRAEVNFNSAPSDAPFFLGPTGGLGGRGIGAYTSRARIMMNIDTRTESEFGVVRTFAAFGPQFTFGTTATGPDTQANGGLRVEAAFVQFAGFTFGRSASAYALPWNGLPANVTAALVGGPTFDAGVNNIQYTWQLGNGLTTSIGLDQQEQANRVGVINGSPTTIVGDYTSAYAAPTAPEIVGNIRLDQAWGLVQFSAAAHQVTGGYYSGTAIAGHPNDKWGFATTGALQLRNLPTGPGDDIKITGTYTEGALRYVLGQSIATPTSYQVRNGNSIFGAPVADGVYGGVGSGIQLTKAFGFNGGFNHHWNETWSSSVFGSWTHVDYNDTARATICQVNYGGSVVCNPDFNISQLGLLTTWTPVKNLAISVEGIWAHLTNNNVGVNRSNASPVLPALLVGQVYNFGNQDIYTGTMRITRSF